MLKNESIDPLKVICTLKLACYPVKDGIISQDSLQNPAQLSQFLDRGDGSRCFGRYFYPIKAV
jgi:hypothetical protein